MGCQKQGFRAIFGWKGRIPIKRITGMGGIFRKSDDPEKNRRKSAADFAVLCTAI